ncbi:hypothetical protein [Treponema sp. C6A8]|uniref:hypothetical protein n=1 Tax=Treponema sp. C6A8 TaxID=1410609 RepID=UPI0004832D64|nr:hypothetical protein [Treponema sp. C6A8]
MGMLLFILILIIAGIFTLGAKGDEWFNHGRCYFDVIDEYEECEPDYSSSCAYDSGSSDSELYGGLPYGDGQIYIVDNEDLIDQMDF